jgi:c-di-GMP-binding flagellar brake protein YcgR
MSKNLRKFERKQIKVGVELTLLDEPSATVTTRDISQGGMFLEVKDADKFPVGEIVSVHYPDPFNNNADTFKSAMIVHKINDGFGICFIETTEYKD